MSLETQSSAPELMGENYMCTFLHMDMHGVEAGHISSMLGSA